MSMIKRDAAALRVLMHEHHHGGSAIPANTQAPDQRSLLSQTDRSFKLIEPGADDASQVQVRPAAY
jgi:hypothetical protein